MFDVHYHLIYGVDDGPKTIEDSIMLGEASIAEGVTHIVATPHSDLRYAFRRDINQEKLAILQECFSGRLVLALGCDFHLTYDNIVDLERNPSRYTLNGKQYLLIEFADLVMARTVSEVLFRIRSAGIVPVITHPERNTVLTGNPQPLKEWVDSGCMIQITAGSLCGDFGRKAKSMAHDLVRKNMVHLVASDAHSVKWRAPSMRRAHVLLNNQFGKVTADRLCLQNPRAVFFGDHLRPQSEINDHSAPFEAGKSGLLSRLLGK